MRREWIEIPRYLDRRTQLCPSPSMRREWIEIYQSLHRRKNSQSPSMRREWIEMYCPGEWDDYTYVSLHAEGVD